jgi:hypothetical protein
MPKKRDILIARLVNTVIAYKAFFREHQLDAHDIIETAYWGAYWGNFSLIRVKWARYIPWFTGASARDLKRLFKRHFTNKLLVYTIEAIRTAVHQHVMDCRLCWD